MNKQPLTDEAFEELLQSVQLIQNIEPSAHFLIKTKALLYKKEQQKAPFSLPSFVHKPAFAIATLMFLVVINGIAVTNMWKHQSGNNSKTHAIKSLVLEYGTAGDNYSDIIQ